MKFMLFRHGVIADVFFADVSLLFFYTHISNLPICCQVSSCLLSLLNSFFPVCFLLLITYLLFIFFSYLSSFSSFLIYSLSLLFFFFIYSFIFFPLPYILSFLILFLIVSVLSLLIRSSRFFLFPSSLFSSLLFLSLSHIASSDSLASDIHIRYPRPRYDKYVNFLY